MLEIIAMLTMLIDHIGKVFFPDMVILQVIGRLAFIIYAYLIALGFSRTGSSIKYLVRIFIVAVISQLFYGILFSWFRLNVCFTLALGILFLKIFSNKKIKNSQKIILCILILLLSLCLGCEYGAYGILTMFIFYLLREQKKYLIIIVQSFLTIISVFIFSFAKIQLFALCTFPLISVIPPKIEKFKCPKHINYLFYPIHLIIIAMVNTLFHL